MSLVLYNYRRCPFCIRVRLVLLYHNTTYEKRDEKLRDWSEEFKAYFKETKPTVPLLLENNEPIYESLNIMQHLNKDLSEQDFEHWGDWSAKTLRDAIQEYKYEDKGVEKLQLLLDELAQKTTPYLTGSKLALADLAVWPFVRQAFRVQPIRLTMKEALQEWYNNIEQHEKLKDVMKKQ